MSLKPDKLQHLKIGLIIFGVCSLIAMPFVDTFIALLAGLAVTAAAALLREIANSVSPYSAVGEFLYRLHGLFKIPVQRAGFDLVDIVATVAVPLALVGGLWATGVVV